MVLLELFWVFMKIGFTSFGGLSMVPVINEQMLSHGWMTQEEVTNILAIAEMTPGPLGINCATFAGTQVAGVVGGTAAVLGVLMPALTTTMLVAVFYKKFKETTIFADILYIIRPICIGLILAVICTLSRTSYLTTSGGALWSNILIGAVAAWMIIYKKKSVPVVILTAGVLGLIIC